MAGEWEIAPGQVLTRAQLAALYGGNARAGRVMASDVTPNVLLFSDPVEDRGVGGSFDGWVPVGGVFSFTGRGFVGDQTWRPTGRSGITSGRDARCGCS